MKMSGLKSLLFNKIKDSVTETLGKTEQVYVPEAPLAKINNQNNPLLQIFRTESAAVSTRPETLLFPYNKKNLIICFTPRSGSSWLTDRIEKTDRLGKAGEYLNPAFLPGILKRYPATSLPGYLNRVLKATASSSGVASVELTWFHLRNYAAAIDLRPLQDSLPKPFDLDSYYMWLCRKDFVAQGVSLYKATESGLFHSPQMKDQEFDPDSILYDGDKLKQWCQHILQQEFGFERWFAKNNIKPLRIFYEDMVEDPDPTLRILFNFVREEFPENLDSITSSHSKIGNSHSEQLVRKFKEEEREFVEYWTINRGIQPAV